MDITGFKAAVFDLDGTLIRSKGVWSEIDRQFFRKRGLEVPDDYCRAVSTKNFRSAAVYTKELLGLEDSVESIMQEWHEMAVYEYTHIIGEVDGAADFLRYLSEKGIKLGLATANSASLYEPVLKRLGVYSLFDSFATTEEVEHGKGFPDVYELACERLGESSDDTIVFEDLPEGIHGAKLGGFTAAACLDDLSDESREIMQQEADICFESYKELYE
ncbi:HAD family phosphatase [Ruminococcus sp.]|uniref:HAD family hydrolase n=1 Tax=Ruminococcus sp. TaxID=41978 RepID=UPI002588198F|nr:HAD family phosphatase [Ruminococcus sp.]MCR5020315.1 HAD family phosphatase [Ruminococcus sp.]